MLNAMENGYKRNEVRVGVVESMQQSAVAGAPVRGRGAYGRCSISVRTMRGQMYSSRKRLIDSCEQHSEQRGDSTDETFAFMFEL